MVFSHILLLHKQLPILALTNFGAILIILNCIKAITVWFSLTSVRGYPFDIF